jgi:hypothetical protein
MLRRTLLSLLAVLILQSASGESLTVAQFRQTLANYFAAHKSDQAIAIKVESVQLSERLTPQTRARVESDFKLGPKSTLALEMQSDMSAFLKPPADEFPSKVPPAPEVRDQIIRKAIDFALVTMHRMPDFLATRVTRRFDNRPEVVSLSGWFPAQTEIQYQGATDKRITYQDGKEVSDLQGDQTGAKEKEIPITTDLTTTGEFGQLLSVALTDASDGKLYWSHWETIEGKMSAVYDFEVPENTSHYWVNFCWLVKPLRSISGRMSSLDLSTMKCYRGKPGYEGTLSVDPETGAVMRISIVPILPREIGLARAAMVIEYGPVKIGGQTYICPQLGVALSIVHYQPTSTVPSRSILSITETSFTDYHRFGSESRIVTDASNK